MVFTCHTRDNQLERQCLWYVFILVRCVLLCSRFSLLDDRIRRSRLMASVPWYILYIRIHQMQSLFAPLKGGVLLMVRTLSCLTKWSLGRTRPCQQSLSLDTLGRFHIFILSCSWCSFSSLFRVTHEHERNVICPCYYVDIAHTDKLQHFVIQFYRHP